jgi:hypothetical protein
VLFQISKAGKIKCDFSKSGKGNTSVSTPESVNPFYTFRFELDKYHMSTLQ